MMTDSTNSGQINQKTSILLLSPFFILLLVNCSSFLAVGNNADTQPVESQSSAAQPPTQPQALTATATLAPATSETSDRLPLNGNDDESTPAHAQKASLGDSLNQPPAKLTPTIGEITFALDIAADNTPLNPGLFFTHGITRVHAIFNYSGLSAGDTWERVWYLNDKEIARISNSWSAPEAGVFDYFIDNSGNPLPAGDWVLEIYVNNQLQALGAFVVETPQDDPGPDIYQLAYTKCDGNHHNIYVANTNGQNEQLIVTRGAGPSWTPDGGAVFFFGEEGVDRQQRDGLEYVFDGISNGIVAVVTSPLPTGINQLRLFQGNAWKQATARWASVSPDGTMVAFDARPGGDYRIYFLGAGINEQQYRIEIPGEQADWSPDSGRIVYRSGRDGKTGLWISNRDDSNPAQISGGSSDSFPAWSPDGQTIAFSRDEGGNVDIYAINVGGGNLRRLTTAPGHDTLPTFAPNGDIIFRSARSGSWGIWKMKGDGSEQVEIISNACVGNDWAFSKMDVWP